MKADRGQAGQARRLHAKSAVMRKGIQEAKRRGIPVDEFNDQPGKEEARASLGLRYRDAGDRTTALGPGSPLGETCNERPSFMAKRKAGMPATLGDDILDCLRDLHRQAATVERSHYYTSRCISDATRSPDRASCWASLDHNR